MGRVRRDDDKCTARVVPADVAPSLSRRDADVAREDHVELPASVNITGAQGASTALKNVEAKATDLEVMDSAARILHC